MNRLGRILHPIAEHLVAAGLLLVAVTPWLAVAEAPLSYWSVFGAVGGATLVSLVLARAFRASTRVEAIVSGLLLSVFLLVVVLRDPLGFDVLYRGLIDGLPRVLSTTLPILDARWASVPGALVAWAGAGLLTKVVIRSRRVAAPLGIALSIFVAGYAVTLGGRSGDPTLAGGTEALALLGLAGLLAILRTQQNLPEGQCLRAIGRVSLAGAIVAGSVGIAAVAVARVPYFTEEPVTPSLSEPAMPREPTSPMLVTRELRAEQPDRQFATITVSGGWSGFTPIAVFDGYDGRVWQMSQDNFLPTGGSIPVEVFVGGGAQAQLEQVDLGATGGWLPFVARVSAVSGLAVLHNGGAALQPAEEEDVVSYDLHLAQGSVHLDDEDLDDEAQVARRAVVPLTVPDPAGDRRPAGERLCRLMTVARDAAAERAVDGEPCGQRGPDTVGFLRALATSLKDGRSVPEELVGGLQLETGAEALSDLLDLVSQSGTQAAVGTPEQFASAYALIANDYGIPARVVTGFRVEGIEGDGSVDLLGAHAWTWVEVPVDGVGWVVVDPAPTAEGVVQEDDQEVAEASEDEQEVLEQDRAVVGVDPSEVIGRAPPPEPMSPWDIVGLIVAGAFGAILLVMLVVAVRRWVRRRRRRDGDARTRMLGAWHEAIDHLYDAGYRDVEALSANEFVREASSRAPGVASRLPWFAEATNRAIFSTRSLENDEVEDWWTLTRELRVDLRRHASWRRRLMAMVWPAPADLSKPRPPRKSSDA